jgi:outer membrane protein TolC
LLAGSGVDFTRVAGPTNPAFGSIAGVSQGVSIARINQDLSLADFEIAVRTALRDIENSYWDLYLSYRLYDTSVTAYESAFQTWREAQTKLEVGTLKKADELQARDRLYETKSSLELALNQLYQTESELRRLVGLPMNDGTVLRPAEEPIVAELKPDWQACLVDGLTQRVELRRQKWQVKSLQLQLDAARSLVRPSLNAVAGYNRLGFGDTLGGQGVYDPYLAHQPTVRWDR